MIASRKLAPRHEPLLTIPESTRQGSSRGRLSSEVNECPICFNYFEGELNVTVCCKHSICTHCFLHTKQKHGTAAQIIQKSTCPFCNFPNYSANLENVAVDVLDIKYKPDEETLTGQFLKQLVGDLEKNDEETKNTQFYASATEREFRHKETIERQTTAIERAQDEYRNSQSFRDNVSNDVNEAMLQEGIRLSLEVSEQPVVVPVP